MELVSTLEHSTIATWVRESPSLWAYPTILFLHTVGLALLVGFSAAIALRLLGCAPRMPIAPLGKFFPVIWAGFWINLLSGTALLAADATAKLATPIFYVKLAFVAAAMVNVVLIRRRVFARPAPDGTPPAPSVRVLALTSLVFWTGAITAGRLMAYFGPVAGAPV